MLNYFPKYFTTKAIYVYIIVLVFCNLYFFSNSLPLIWIVFGCIEVIGFFYFSNRLISKWSNLSTQSFTKKLFITALLIRIIWVVFSYFFFDFITGQPFEFGAADALGYHKEAKWLASMIQQGNLQPYYDYINGRYSDMGYPYYLGWQYWFTGGSIIMARLIKALLSSYICVIVYNLSNRNFGVSVGRMASIFCMLMPNLIYYTGLHTKEVEMVFLTVLFVDRTDFLFRVRKYNFINIGLPLLLAGSLFFFRTVLGVTALFSFFSTLVLTSNKIIGIGKRTIIILWTIIAVGYFVGGKVSTEVENTWFAKSANQDISLEFRSTRDNGNKLAKYASSAAFVPLIFVIPFPTLIKTPNQDNQQMIHGGNYVKNIMAFFVLFSVFFVIRNGIWRNYVLIGSFTIGYLLVIANSAFAQSERFHQPALPFLLIMAAFGISQFSNTEKLFFRLYLIVIVIAIVIWSWFKLSGRGLV